MARSARKGKTSKVSERAWPKRRPKYGERVPGGVLLRGASCPDEALDLVTAAYFLAFAECEEAIKKAFDSEYRSDGLTSERCDGFADLINKEFANIFSKGFLQSLFKMVSKATQLIRTNVNESLRQVPTVKAHRYLNKGDSKLDAFKTRNINLIKSVGENVKASARKVIDENPNEHPSTLWKKLQERTGVNKSKAKLWARDQTLKLHAQIVKDKHTSLGIKEYYWRTSGDERVRNDPKNGDHLSLGAASDKGVRYKYAKPPIVALKGLRRCNPGDDYECRCTADPILPD